MKNKLFYFLLTQLLVLQGLGQNVGIGTTSPAYKLDISGRMRIQNSAQTAGIWLDGPTNPNRAFMGIFDNNHVGFYGATTGWKFSMNVVNGNVGIGLSAPTAALDVNGPLRLRGSDFPNIPRAGSLLTSVDENGNAEWQRPVVFKTNGMNAAMDVPGWQWTKVAFKTSGLEVNEGFYYDPFTSTFNAPVRGIYHFDAKAYVFSTVAQNYMRLVVVRNGTVIREYRDQDHVCATCYNYMTDGFNELAGKIRNKTLSVSVGFPLEKNDKVWMEVYCSAFEEEGIMQVQAEANSTWFYGHLVYRY